MTYFDLFSEHVNELVEETDRFAAIEQDLSANAAQEMINEITERLNQKNEYRLSESDLATVLEFSDPETRRELIETGLISLRESYKIGIYDKEDKNFDFGDQSIALFKRGDEVSQSRIESNGRRPHYAAGGIECPECAAACIQCFQPPISRWRSPQFQAR